MNPVQGLAVGAVMALAAACAGPPEVRYEPVEVPVPIKQPCIASLPAEPKWLVDQQPVTGPFTPEQDFALSKAYVAEREQRDQYERELRAAMAGCMR